MSASLSPETISIIKSTAPVMQKHGVAITTRMGGRRGGTHSERVGRGILVFGR
ncbi:hemoglobin-like flavoprotein [Paraburkholderia sp. JPY158]|uniref:Hemoglobin-like flavoprotein n=1 Tax=Paraburkholderia atlantica TaxID=2654982 RepID=A0A7W8QBL3_PARAM|nr:hemoglobin-like flavoprotein [Paraburkholderia atlantica]